MKILICDDHKIMRDGLKKILNLLPDVSMIEEAGSGEEAMLLLKSVFFDILILDISLPDKNGIEILQMVKEKWPALNVLMLSMHPQQQYAIRAFKHGASGYLTKEAASEELLRAVQKVSAGGKYITSSMAEDLVARITEDVHQQKHELLSGREFEIMIKLAKGISLKAIGGELFISANTVSTYRSRIMEKMEFSKNSELTIYCIDNNLISGFL